jgi:uncharacterized membrane protein YeaQ/YmgE (transglycosylase-associated protein family)
MSVLTYAHEPALIAFAAALSRRQRYDGERARKGLGTEDVSPSDVSRGSSRTSGAMSVEGTIAGLAGALTLRSGGLVADNTGGRLGPVVIGATGSLVESLLAATLEGPGILNNDLLNFFNTAIGALAAVLIAGAIA